MEGDQSMITKEDLERLEAMVRRVVRDELNWWSEETEEEILEQFLDEDDGYSPDYGGNMN